tara:strand:+ start:340 stop:912 length:573 start_codon:yes stop_codon:yes gene_type:complete
MIRIAVVGDIGSGKTYIAKLFGFPVFNADKNVAEIYKKSRLVYKKLKTKLPEYIISFPVKKSHISNAIRNNPRNIKLVSKIIHPVVRKRMREFLRKNSSKKAVVLDIPLYFENNLNRNKDIVVFVSSRKELINRALKKRNKSNLKLLKKLSKLQLPLEKKKKKSDYVIKNYFNKADIKKKVNIVKRQIFL